jgi:hypothetical protein
MKLAFKNGGAASESDIEKLQLLISEKLPADFLEFVLKHDGSEPEPNTFQVGSINESGVNRFIPIKEIQKETRRIENLSRSTFPVAWAEGGNYVLLNGDENGAMYFWDHERPDELIKLADSFGSFIASLRSFDVNSVQLSPGQVKKVWIDPDFLDSLKGTSRD